MFFLNLLLFTIFQIFIVYPLGKLILNFLEINKFVSSEKKLWWVQNLIFCLILGMVFLTLLVFGLGYANLYNFLPVILVISPVLLFFELKNISFRGINFKGFLDKGNLVVILAILACVFIQSAIVFPNGVTSEGDIRLKGVFMEDVTWHIGIINNLQEGIPPENPLFGGEKLVNYHYFTDIFIATIYKFTNIEILTLYFRLVGPFLAFLFASSLYFMLKELTGNRLISAFGILLVILSSTYYYIFGFLKPGLDINPGSFFGNDYEARMVNYQLLSSYLIITTFVFFLLTYKKINSVRFFLIGSMLIGGGLGFKSYGTLLFVVALYVVGFLKILKKEFTYLKMAFSVSIFTLFIAFFLRNNSPTEPVFTFKPLWLIENMFSDPIRLHTPAWEAQKNWFLQNGNYFGVAYLYLKGMIIFLFANLGLRILGFLPIFQEAEKRKKDVIFILGIMAFIGITLPLFFMQGGVGWNTIQFFFYSSVLLGILLIVLLAQLQKKFGLRLVVTSTLIIWISFLPGVFLYSKHYLSDEDNLARYNYQGTQDAYKAAKFLSSETSGILLLDSKYLQTPFIPAISRKNAYFADITIMSNQLINWKDRNEKIEKFFDNLATEEYRKNFLKDNNIIYIFTAKNSLDQADYLKRIYTNMEISIYKTIQND